MALGAAQGRWMDGKSAEDHAASAALVGDEVVVSSDTGAELGRFPIRTARVSTVGGGGVIHIESPAQPDALLVLDDALFVAGLRAGGAAVRGAATGRRALIVGLGCFLAFAGLACGFYVAAPHIANALAQRVSPSIEATLTPKMAGFISRSTCTGARSAEAIRSLVRRIAPEREGTLDIRIVNLQMANAFALPGGVVLLTRGLVEGAESGDEVAGVLAHEIAHVEHRHALAHMIRSALLAGSWTATLGDYSGLMIVDPKTAYDIATLRFSREAEAEADEGALRMLTAQHVSTRGLVAFLERNGKLEKEGATWLSSHPSSSDRISRLEHQVLSEAATPAIDTETMYELRKACDDTRLAPSIRDLFF
jgi:Zn-dependent protease with chaperone function